MSEQCVVGVYSSFRQARNAVQALEHSEFPSAQVSLATHSVSKDPAVAQALEYGDETEHRAAAGAGFGGLVGMLLGAPLLTIPGVGVALLAGPIAAGLTGAIVGGFLGAMSGWGVHKDHIAKYEKQVNSGKLLVIANGTPDEVALARDVLRGTDADEVKLHARTSADAPEIDE